MFRCLMSFLFSFVLFFATPVNATSYVESIPEKLDCEQAHCVGVVDAGSTGSRLHLYTYLLDKNQSPIQVTERWVHKVNPGFASLTANQDSIDAYLNQLFSNAPNTEMPIYFYATAGMRLLSQPKQMALYEHLNAWFSHHGHWKLIAAKTITGKEEGTWGWLAVNYQLGVLNSHSGRDLVGVMDMGGASVQVSFPLLSDDTVSEQDVESFDLYGHHFNLFVHSFLGLGQTEVAHQFFDTKSCFSSDYPLSNGQLADGDAVICQRNISILVNSVHHVSGVVQQAIRTNAVSNWYVMGGLESLLASKPFAIGGHQYTSEDMLKQGNNLCHRNWDSLQSNFPGDDYLYGDCLFSSYYYALMVDGYGLESDRLLHTLPVDNVADWTMGVVLMQK